MVVGMLASVVVQCLRMNHACVSDGLMKRVAGLGDAVIGSKHSLVGLWDVEMLCCLHAEALAGDVHERAGRRDSCLQLDELLHRA